jgi:hypothetical protein
MKKYKAYLLKNFDTPVAVFWLRRDAIALAKENVSSHPDYKWNDIYQIVKVEISEVDASTKR